MNTPDQCPFCGSRKIFPAQFLDDERDDGSAWVRFPEIQQFPWWQLATFADEANRDVPVENPTTCLGCGRLWSQFDLNRALELVQRYGSNELKAKLADMEQPPR